MKKSIILLTILLTGCNYAQLRADAYEMRNSYANPSYNNKAFDSDKSNNMQQIQPQRNYTNDYSGSGQYEGMTYDYGNYQMKYNQNGQFKGYSY